MEMINCIQAVLIRKKMSQKELARLTGKSLNTISSICINKSQPHLKDLKKIAKILDVDIRELLVPTLGFMLKPSTSNSSLCIH
jgi:transcriptional regulator with XRE-family HTH domain